MEARPIGHGRGGIRCPVLLTSAAVAAGAVIIIVVAGLIWLKGSEIRAIKAQFQNHSGWRTSRRPPDEDQVTAESL